MNYSAIASDLLNAGVRMPDDVEPAELIRSVIEAEADRQWDASVIPSDSPNESANQDA
jgi:hypothetical protein